MEIKLKENLELSEDQSKALDNIKEWLYKPITCQDDCLYRLTGSAGTGKTTLLAKLVSDLQGIFKSKKCVSAPTHKAKKVITQKTGCENSETVQALLGLKPDLDLENFDINNPTFSPVSSKKLSAYKLILIDEASMINNDLYAAIVDDAVNYGVKLLFIGDTLQLPPINEVISKSLISPVNGYNLTEIIRQKSTNPLLGLLEVLRQDIIDNTENFRGFLLNNPINMAETEGYSCCTPQVFADNLTEHFKSMEYQQDRNRVRYISWTNESIQKANRFIRKQMYTNDEHITDGELLLGYKTVVREEEMQVLVLNSEDYVVSSYSHDTDYNGIKVIYAKIKSLDDDTDKTHTIKIVVPEKANEDAYLSARELLLSAAIARRGKAWKYYYEFRNSYILLTNIMEESYGKQKIADRKDIDYGYGITIHKSQGSTYHTVFVDFKNILKSIEIAEQGKNMGKHGQDKVDQARLDCKKLLYVAVSRASNKVYINF